jgi:hypothetical protein
MGTEGSSAFKDAPKSDGSGKTEILFNTPGDGNQHGHVVQSTDADGEVTYHYARDVEGTVYIDDGKP